MTPIHIMALRHSAFYTPLLVTVAGGYLQEEGLEPHYRVATADDPIPEALLAGTAHLAQSAPAVAFASLERGEAQEILHFTRLNGRDGFWLAARPGLEIRGWSDLAGREVLADHLFQPLATLRHLLRREGVEGAVLTDAGSPEAMERAFRQRRGDLVQLQGPAPRQLEEEGIGQVVLSVGEALGPIAFSSLCATRRWLDTDMARAFGRAWRRALRRVAEAPVEELAELVAPFLEGITSAALIRTLQDYRALGCWSTEPSFSREEWDGLLEVFLGEGLITRRHPMESVIAPFPD